MDTLGWIMFGVMVLLFVVLIIVDQMLPDQHDGCTM